MSNFDKTLGQIVNNNDSSVEFIKKAWESLSEVQKKYQVEYKHLLADSHLINEAVADRQALWNAENDLNKIAEKIFEAPDINTTITSSEITSYKGLFQEHKQIGKEPQLSSDSDLRANPQAQTLLEWLYSNNWAKKPETGAEKALEQRIEDHIDGRLSERGFPMLLTMPTAGCRSLDPKSEAHSSERPGVNLSDHRCKWNAADDPNKKILNLALGHRISQICRRKIQACMYKDGRVKASYCQEVDKASEKLKTVYETIKKDLDKL